MGKQGRERNRAVAAAAEAASWKIEDDAGTASTSKTKVPELARRVKLEKAPKQEQVSEPRDPSPSPAVRRKPFRFFDMPPELRLRVYEEVLLLNKPIDLDPLNYRIISPRLALFLVCHRMHEEAYRVFYAQTLRLFPYHGRFFHTKKPLLERLPVRYRKAVTSMDIRFGPGWSSPPKNQNTKPGLGLADCTSMKLLKIFVECDPSDNIFQGFRGNNATEDTYKWFCVDLLAEIIEQVPSLVAVELDAYPGVKKDAPLILALQRKIIERKKVLLWGPLRGWEKDGDEPGLIGLENAMSSLGISTDMVVVRA